MPAAFSFMFGVEPEVQKRVVVRARNENDVAAASAVTAAWAASGYELFAPERQTAITAVAGFYGNEGFVYKHWRRNELLLSKDRQEVGEKWGILARAEPASQNQSRT
jgi:hypothetical protein